MFSNLTTFQPLSMYSAYEASINELTKKNKAMSKETETVVGIMVIANRQKDEAFKKLSVADATIAELTAKNVAALAENETAKATIADMSNRIIQLNIVTSGSKILIDNERGEKRRLEADNDTLSDRLGAEQNKRRGMEATIEDLRSDKEDLKDEVRLLQAEVERLEREKEEALRNQLNGEQNKRRRMADSIEDLHADNEDLNDQAGILQVEVERLEAENNQVGILQVKVERLEAENKLLREDNEIYMAAIRCLPVIKPY